ncbi:sensor histidine kinase KdpD [Paenibacillus sp. NFR01]|uniref:sensor histidine kinase n=1 Tax=Paenibacillus sp. NFR01 TaxID=1566279 RepID=UPI0008D75105|nr:sensor histidine kinase [Paenibacillus sp. NFR01]SES90351.1 His Kinase A (phospho-acceptor) domain-containing protein [Paenibacillus sp. NFR01]
MTEFYILPIVLLVLVIVWQQLRLRGRAKQLAYVHTKLEEIIGRQSHERLLLFSDDPELQKLLIAVNLLLDTNHKGTVERNRLERSLRSMLANISHDLKTPLTVILGYIETLLESGELPEADKQAMLRTIQGKAQEVTLQINRFFDLAKLESGDKEIPLTRVEAGEVCRRNILDFYDLIGGKGFDVQIDIPDEPLYIMGNAEALGRILSNLLSNAIAYGDGGGVLGLRLAANDEKVEIEVWDKGKGIPESQQAKVFERLYTLEDSRNRVYQGSGLGLAIVKKLTEAMNGSISLKSQAYSRTSFTLSFRRLHY